MAAMFARESLWQRRCGAGWWPLAWALAAACAVPWLVPERWSGHLPGWAQVLGWLAVLLGGFWAAGRIAGVSPSPITQ